MRANLGNPAYAASKAGAVSLTKLGRGAGRAMASASMGWRGIDTDQADRGDDGK